MDNNDFFNKPNPAGNQPETPTQPAEEQKVKIGEKEYSHDEAAKLVGLGETAREYETKWNRPISDFYPDYTQKSQALAEYKKREQDEEQRRLAEKQQVGEDLSLEEKRKLAIQQAKELGIVTKDEFDGAVNQAVANAMAVQKIITQTESFLKDTEKKGMPKVDMVDLFSYMNGDNPSGTRFGTPEKAYNDKFEKEISAWKEQQLSTIRPTGMVTNQHGMSNNQVPQLKQITRESLSQAIRESLTRSQGV